MMRVSYGGYSETRLPANPEDLLLNPSPWIVGSGVVFSFSTNKANRQPARKPTDFHRLSHATTSAYRTHQFMKMMYAILKSGGKMICSDFHPFTKIADILNLQQPSMSYFDTSVFEGEMAHARFFDEEIRKQMPKCSYRKYTISEILNAIIKSGFVLEKFDEHPAWTNSNVPGEFTAVANKR